MESIDNNGVLEEETTIDFQHYIALFLQWWWVVAAATLLAGVISFFVTRQITPVYQASSTVLVNEAPSTRTDYTSLMTSERVAGTYAQMMTKRTVLDEVGQQLGVLVDKDMVTVSTVRDTQLLTITVENTNPQLAADIANKVLEVFSQQIQTVQESRFAASKSNLEKQIQDSEATLSDLRKSLENVGEDETNRDRLESRLAQTEQIYSNLLVSYEEVRLTEAQVLSNLVEVERAQAPLKPVRPNTLQNTLLAALVGLFLSAGGLLAYDMLDDTIVDPGEINRRFGLPVVGMIMHHEDSEELVTLKHPRSPVSEAYRALRTNIQYADVDRPVRTLVVTSATPSEGKTKTVSNLAVVMMQGGRRVTVIDADMRRPRIHREFHLAFEPGLSSLFLQPNGYMNGTCQSLEGQNLRVVTAGALPPNPSELLGSEKMKNILETVQKDSDLVILDTPPVLSVTDAVTLAPVVDGVLLIVRVGETKRGALKQAVEQLRYVGARILGIVINDVGNLRSKYGYYYKNYYYKRYYHYYEHYSDGDGNKKHKRIRKESEKSSLPDPVTREEI